MRIGDSHYGEWRDKLRLKTSDEQDRACLFLEGRGQRFMVEFGIENAIGKAKQLSRELRSRAGER